jgi:hypothetical protein
MIQRERLARMHEEVIARTLEKNMRRKISVPSKQAVWRYRHKTDPKTAA